LTLLEDPVRLWWAIAGTIGQVDEYIAIVSELVAIRLLEGPADDIGHWLGDKPGISELALFASEVLLAQGWRRGKTPLTAQDVNHDVWEPLREWRIFGFLADRPISREHLSGGRSLRELSTVGKQAMLAFLYRRATAAN
jgi:hypothetical protein